MTNPALMTDITRQDGLCTVAFPELVKRMVEADLALARQSG